MNILNNTNSLLIVIFILLLILKTFVYLREFYNKRYFIYSQIIRNRWSESASPHINPRGIRRGRTSNKSFSKILFILFSLCCALLYFLSIYHQDNILLIKTYDIISHPFLEKNINAFGAHFCTSTALATEAENILSILQCDQDSKNYTAGLNLLLALNIVITLASFYGDKILQNIIIYNIAILALVVALESGIVGRFLSSVTDVVSSTSTTFNNGSGGQIECSSSLPLALEKAQLDGLILMVETHTQPPAVYESYFLERYQIGILCRASITGLHISNGGVRRTSEFDYEILPRRNQEPLITIVSTY